MKINVHLLGLVLCFLGCTLYLLFDAHHTHAIDTAEPIRQTGGPLYREKSQWVQAPSSRLKSVEHSIHQHMDTLVREKRDLAKVTELTRQLQQLVNEYIELATQELKKCMDQQKLI